MSDLHKPLTGPSQKPSALARVPVIAWFGVAGAVLLGTLGWLYMDRRDDGSRVVAINAPAARTPAAQKPAVAPSNSAPTAVPNEPVEPRYDENGKLILDLTGIKPLSPLEPLPDDPDGAAPAKPAQPQVAFRPQTNNAVATARRRPWSPVPDVLEPSEFGRLPKVAGDGTRPLDVHSSSSGTVGANRIALVIGGLGLSQTGTQSAIEKLPGGVTLAFSPFGNSLQRWMQAARMGGHEVALQLAMEPLGYPTVDPGPNTLNSQVDVGANLKSLRWSLGRMTNYPVVMNYLGAGMLSKDKALTPILTEIRNRGLAVLDDGTVRASRLPSLAASMRVPHASGALVIDEVRSDDRIRARLATLEAMARQQGNVIATATAFPQTVNIVEDWAKGLAARGILLVPVSNLVKDYSR